MERRYIFPEGFLWGSGTSAWQIEGGVIRNEYFEMRQQGKIAGNVDPAESAGFWKYYESDIALMMQMNHKVFRMSVEWARIEPEEGRFDEEAIRHYRKIIQTVRDAGILPIVDLHHHSNPLWVYKYGGWTSPRMVRHLTRYAEKVTGALGDVVTVWMTVNEPTMWASWAYLAGEMPPYKKSLRLFFKCMDIYAQAHVALYDTVNAVYAGRNWGKPMIGFANAMHAIDPVDPGSMLDRLAARQIHKILEERFLAKILRKRRTIDVMGINYYLCMLAKFPLEYRLRTDLPQSKEGWPIDPPGLYRVLTFAWEKYGIPIWITENGVGEDDDELRPRFLLDHIYQMHRAISAGVDLRAYCHWATVDTLEYHKGFGIKYGLIRVDFDKPEKPRTLRNSARMYAEIAASNGITEDIVARYVPDWNPESFPEGYSRKYG